MGEHHRREVRGHVTVEASDEVPGGDTGSGTQLDGRPTLDPSPVQSVQQGSAPSRMVPCGRPSGGQRVEQVPYLVEDPAIPDAPLGHLLGDLPHAVVGDSAPGALVETGDTITIDAVQNRLDVDLTQEELSQRRSEWTAPPLKFTRGTLYKYIKTVKSASEGCVTDE